jgi:DNA/RNA endonuclease YhcR with UshA esterase domain
MRKVRAIVALSFALFLVPSDQAQKKITAPEAKDHINESATVCGNVVSARFSASTKGQPTFLNLEKPYPSQIFTVVIWGSDRAKFGTPETEYKGKRICVTGKIENFRGVPEIVASDPQQIKAE